MRLASGEVLESDIVVSNADPAWTYGLAELDSGQRDKIRMASRVSNPGCYPTGFLLLTRPLIEVRRHLLPRLSMIHSTCTEVHYNLRGGEA